MESSHQQLHQTVTESTSSPDLLRISSHLVHPPDSDPKRHTSNSRIPNDSAPRPGEVPRTTAGRSSSGVSTRKSRPPRPRPSRATISYPRKRAITACQLCRTRKTKCDNARPTCRVCASSGAECVYESPSNLSSFDPASLLMLQRLDQILERLDGHHTPSTDAHLPPQLPTCNSDPYQFVLDQSENPQLSIPHSQLFTQPTYETPHDVEYMNIPAARSTADKVLLWPIFENQYAPNTLVDTLFEAESDSVNTDETPKAGNLGSLTASGFLASEDIRPLIDRFLTFVHTKNPILDVESLRGHAARISEDGLGWDETSCLVLLCCALGSLARPFSNQLRGTADDFYEVALDSISVFDHEIQSASSYFALARKRIGLLRGNIMRAQCLFLSGVYLMYRMRPLEAWQNFVQASTAYHIYLKGREKRRFDDTVSDDMRRLEQRLFWSCFKSECEIRLELDLPESGISGIDYPDMFPSPPNPGSPLPEIIAATTPIDPHSITPQSDGSTPRRHNALVAMQNQQQSWYYYLTEIALRRIGNTIQNVFYKSEHHPAFGFSVPMMVKVANDFEDQLSQWHAGLPEAIAFDLAPSTIPSSELPYMIRTRFHSSRLWLLQPFIYYAIHHPLEDPYQPLIRPFVNKCIDICFEIIQSTAVRHRHHGTWFNLRNGMTAALIILATVKSSQIETPLGWSDVVRIQLASQRYWERESPDIAKSRELLESMLTAAL